MAVLTETPGGGRLQIGIAGAGLLGRLLAWRLVRAGHCVSVFDPADGPEPRFDGHQAAGHTAAGMLSPLAERETSSDRVAALGWRSIALWRETTAALNAPGLLSTRGSLLLAHRSDLASARRVLARLNPLQGGAAAQSPLPQSPWPQSGSPEALTPAALATLEPALQGAAHAWLLPGEGHIDAVATLRALHAQAPGVNWHWQQRVAAVAPGRLYFEGLHPEGHPTPIAPVSREFDLVFDVRGCGARPDLPVRGVRGEIVWLQAPGHGLTRPVRLLHPRHRVYLVPRAADTVLVGASDIESEDRSPVSLRSAVELMGAAHSVLPALAEARIARLDVNLRPALPDNEPRLHSEPGLVRINGLFRHGWLLAPALVQDALAALAGLPPDLGPGPEPRTEPRKNPKALETPA